MPKLPRASGDRHVSAFKNFRKLPEEKDIISIAGCPKNNFHDTLKF